MVKIIGNHEQIMIEILVVVIQSHPSSAKPLVLDFEKSKNLIQDEKMELQCVVLGFPKAVVSWSVINKCNKLIMSILYISI